MLGSTRTHTLLLWLSLLSRLGLGRYIEDNDAADGLYSLLSLDQKRESEDFIFRRPLRCLDMLATEGQFTFMAAQPQLACAAFLIGEPSEVISLELSDVNIDCSAGDFIKIFDGWVLKGDKFPSTQDHPLPLQKRYTDYCSSNTPGGASRSSQNVAMVFFRIHSADSGFTLTVKKQHNPFRESPRQQQPEWLMVSGDPALSNGIQGSLQTQVWRSCSGSGDHVELLGGNGVDTSKMYPMADLCFSPSGLTQMRMGCDNSVVRLVSSGNYINRVRDLG
ncbi:hypothetical protein CRUP_012431 [Coryphaenoides rupestris]|nr:hypothetical protein CRUP_012431 [Coryphaenoides rupestris]